MRNVYTKISSGIPELDSLLQGILPGDNVVWQVDSISDYKIFAEAFCREALKNNKVINYFRFADHPALVPEGANVVIYNINSDEGFEPFISQIYETIEARGKGALYLFDSLSELTADWYSDRMLGNFFFLACPYLYDYDTVAYFALLRNNHAPIAINTIHKTAQVVLDVYKENSKIFIQPLKVFKRYSPTMYMLNKWENGELKPVTNSAAVSSIMTTAPQTSPDFAVPRLDIWAQTFEKAQRLIQNKTGGKEVEEEKKSLFNQILKMSISRDSKALKLLEKYFNLEDLHSIGKRMIGTGFIGGKSVGMLLARAILEKTDSKWKDILEPHDSFYIGSDVFYTYLIQNDCWQIRRKWKKSGMYLDGIEEIHERMLKGAFSKDIKKHFSDILDYFGQSPVIVRSSSLLEDAYGASFSGKYESVFCANQGSPAERLENFMSAVRIVYASAMSRDALSYRLRWGLIDREEQMALLVQRVSGVKYQELFFPQIAGVGFSFNPFIWNNDIDPKSGVIRLVFGLGTRAVDRNDDDYTRIVALNVPQKRPETSVDEIRRYSQRKVDVLDLKANIHRSEMFENIAKDTKDLPVEMFASYDYDMESKARELGIKEIFPYVLTFENLISKTNFINDMKEALATLQKAYDYPVDIEFTLNFISDTEYKINIVQCRPFQVKRTNLKVEKNFEIDDKKIIIKTLGPVIGTSSSIAVNRLIYIVPSFYSQLNMSSRYSVARLIGKLTHRREEKNDNKNIALLGPGRWGTTTPSLGVPVSFAEIDRVSTICEIAVMREGLIPDVSLGTHFFNDIVEMDITYLAIYPEKDGNRINEELLNSLENSLTKLIPDASMWSDVVKVIENRDGINLRLYANPIEQVGILYIDNAE